MTPIQNLFLVQAKDEFVARINKLNSTSPAQWGKMDVAQMLKHCQVPLKVASGELVPKTNPIIKFLFGKAAKKKLVGAQPFGRNLPTMGEAKISEKQDFEKEKRELIRLIENYQTRGEEGLTPNPHPFFGRMNASEWNTLQVKHLDHHLRQFGV